MVTAAESLVRPARTIRAQVLTLVNGFYTGAGGADVFGQDAPKGLTTRKVFHTIDPSIAFSNHSLFKIIPTKNKTVRRLPGLDFEFVLYHGLWFLCGLAGL